MKEVFYVVIKEVKSLKPKLNILKTNLANKEDCFQKELIQVETVYATSA